MEQPIQCPLCKGKAYVYAFGANMKRATYYYASVPRSGLMVDCPLCNKGFVPDTVATAFALMYPSYSRETSLTIPIPSQEDILLLKQWLT
jgi:hypothetical protein